jgi:hypothetical protein
LSYARKIFGLPKALDDVKDRRKRPRIKTGIIVRSALVMFLSRLGSLNALEQTRQSRFWTEWIDGKLPSADSVGRVCALIDHDDLRLANRELYSRLKRNKALAPPWHGLMALVLDGHESHSTYHRRCSGCLERIVKTKNGERIQYYHRNVTAQLITDDFQLLLDAEPQRPEEYEIATALRLLERVFTLYPRAFDVVIGDALYTDPRFFNFIVSQGKHALTVLKDDRRDLLKDAKALFETMQPLMFTDGRKSLQVSDVEGFTSWPQVETPVRVVRSEERVTIKRQIDGELEEQVSNWFWVTTLPANLANSRAVVEIGHARWTIENQGFNETSTRWHADHVYKHDGDAILSFWLLCMIALNVFHAFFLRNLKPVFRATLSMLHVSRQILGELYGQLPKPQAHPP